MEEDLPVLEDLHVSITFHTVLFGESIISVPCQKVQCLQPGDLPRRQEFCEWILAEDNAQPNFLNNVIYTDEAGFTQEGVFNVHNNTEALGQIPATIRKRAQWWWAF
jgi:hypothetical protein